jgi:hypothetical protein
MNAEAQSTLPTAAIGRPAGHARRLSLLKWILGFGILSTGLHFTHNFVAIDQYPDGLVSGAVVQVAILVSWPLFTLVGLAGYRLYAARSYERAHACLAAYGFFGLVTLGHFLDGSPDIAPFWFATIFTDALAGVAMLTFTTWSARVAVPAELSAE